MARRCKLAQVFRPVFRFRTSPRALARRAAGQSGFSLAEAIAVMALIAISALVAAPYLAKIERRRQITGVASEIQTTLLAARMRAVKRNAPSSVAVTPAAASTPTHILYSFEPPLPTPTPQYTRDLLIDSRSVNFVTLPPGNLITFGGSGGLVAPSGAAVIVIQGPANAPTPNQITIQTDPNGRVKVITPSVWY